MVTITLAIENRVFCWASCHVRFSCRWLHTQTDQFARDGSGGSSVGTKRRSRCREIVLTLFAKGHHVGHMRNKAYQSLRQLRRMAEQRPETFTELQRVWHCCANGEAICDKPLTMTHRILRWMGWHWQAPGLFARERHPPLDLLDGPESWWLHEISQGMRLAEWRHWQDSRHQSVE